MKLSRWPVSMFVLIALCLCFTSAAQAFEGHCGTFEMKGILRSEDGFSKLYLNQGSSSELTVTFEKHEMLSLEIDGVPMHLNFEISSRCRFHCKGRLNKVVAVLDPFDSVPPSPLGHIVPVRSKKCSR